VEGPEAAKTVAFGSFTCRNRNGLAAFSSLRRVSMKHYRINKLAKVDGVVIKKKDILAGSDAEAVRHAADDDDCPICDVLRDGRKVGAIT
jgi:hypothetical protein